MRRNLSLAVGLLLFATAWFLSVHEYGKALPARLSGWGAFQVALSPKWDGAPAQCYAAVLSVASALTNLLVVILVLAWRARSECPIQLRDRRLWHPLGLVAVCVPLLTGCAAVEKYSLTYRVWDNEDWRKYSEPAPSPNLALFEATNHADVLVQYDAFSEKHSRVERQAYYLHWNQARVGAGTKPELVKSSVADGLKAIPVLPSQGALTNQPPDLSAYAVVIKEGRGFALYRPMEPGSAFDLPVYVETSGTPTRVLWTPFAVAGDTVMVGVVAAAVGFFCWLEVQTPTFYFY